MARLHLTLLGAFQATLDGGPVRAFGYDKVRALLAYLATESERPQRRERLAGLLWRLPRELDQLLSQTTRGELEVRAAPSRELERMIERLERAINRIIDMIAFAGFLLAGVFLLDREFWLLGWLFLALAFVTAVYVVLRR